MTDTMHLRAFQLMCILLVLACVGLVHWRHNWADDAITLRHWIVIAAATWSVISGFTLQRRIVNRPTSSVTSPRRSTPFRRWRAGNLIRLASATSTGVWGVVLSDFGGRPWMVNALFAIGLLLLLVWTPESSPARS